MKENPSILNKSLLKSFCLKYRICWNNFKNCSNISL